MIENIVVVFIVSVFTTLIFFLFIEKSRGSPVRKAEFQRELSEITYQMETLRTLTDKMNKKYATRDVRNGEEEGKGVDILSILNGLNLDENIKKQIMPLIPLIMQFLKK